MPEQPLWTPSEKRKSGSNLRRFMDELESSEGVRLQSYADILGFSTARPEVFWLKLWEFCGVVAETRGKPVLVDGDNETGRLGTAEFVGPAQRLELDDAVPHALE